MVVITYLPFPYASATIYSYSASPGSPTYTLAFRTQIPQSFIVRLRYVHTLLIYRTLCTDSHHVACGSHCVFIRYSYNIVVYCPTEPAAHTACLLGYEP